MSQRRVEPMALDDLKVGYWKGVLYGAPGIGKTVMATTSQKMRTVVLDVDDGIVATKAYLRRHGLSSRFVKFLPIKEVADFVAAVDWVERHVSEIDLLVVDTATELQRLVIREICERVKHQTPDQRDWGTALTTMENVTASFRHMPFHMIYVCHEMSKADQMDSAEKWRPSFQGAFKTEYAKHFSFIGRYVLSMRSVQNGEGKGELKVVRAVHFGADPYMESKDRSAALDKWEQPNIDDVFDKLIGSGTTPDGGDNSNG